MPKKRRYNGYNTKLSKMPRISTKGYLETELKFVDHELALTTVTSAWQTLNPTTINCLSAVATGNTESTRVGRIYYIHSIHLQGTVLLAAIESQAQPGNDILVRVAVVLDKQTNETEMTATDCFDAGQSTDVLAFRNLQNSKRFSVLYDKRIMMKPHEMNEGSADLFAHGDTNAYWKFNRKFKTPIKVICSGTTAVVGSISNNAFHVCAVALQSGPTFQYQVRTRFTD